MTRRKTRQRVFCSNYLRSSAAFSSVIASSFAATCWMRATLGHVSSCVRKFTARILNAETDTAVKRKTSTQRQALRVGTHD